MAKTVNRKSISPYVLLTLKPSERKYLLWDDKVRGLAVEVQPTGYRSWKFI
jgi:hypothetical protein